MYAHIYYNADIFHQMAHKSRLDIKLRVIKLDFLSHVSLHISVLECSSSPLYFIYTSLCCPEAVSILKYKNIKQECRPLKSYKSGLYSLESASNLSGKCK